MNREQLFRAFFIGVFLYLAYQILHILSPFFTGILGAIVLTIIFYPLHRWIQHRAVPGSPNAAAGLSTALTVGLVFIPFGVLSWLLFNELAHLYPVIKEFSSTMQSVRLGDPFNQPLWLLELQSRLQIILDITEQEVQNLAVTLTNAMLHVVTGTGKQVLRNLFIAVVNLAAAIFTMFFLFKDGPALLRVLKDLLPMDLKHKEHIVHQIYITMNAVVRGVFIVAVTQGTLAGLGFFIAGVPSPVLLGALTLVFAMVPLVGTPAVWLPLSIIYFLQGSVGKASFIVLWGVFVVGLIDNFLRPVLIGTRAKLPILFLFFGLLGGVKMYGPVGLFLGPLVIALAIAFVKIYRELYPQPSSE